VKIVISRKGVDSSAGGFASPVFADNRMLSIPIPDERSSVRYRDIQTDDEFSVAKLVKDLSRGKLTAARRAHVDPDLSPVAMPRTRGWQPLFGQCGAAQSHLQSHRVGAGDVFLFFGWFRRVESYRRRWRYVPGAKDKHVLYGWMQIESVEPVEALMQSKKLSWAHYHPHCHGKFQGSNRIYLAARKLSFTDKNISGAGVFDRYREELCLTEAGRSRSHWRLPLWMHPEGRNSTLSYHSDSSRWTRKDDHVLLRAAARGQEFVLDLEDYPEGLNWLRELIAG